MSVQKMKCSNCNVKCSVIIKRKKSKSIYRKVLKVSCKNCYRTRKVKFHTKESYERNRTERNVQTQESGLFEENDQGSYQAAALS